jgi:nucleotidyltransferase/DNA polymerase involved in DNA repair
VTANKLAEIGITTAGDLAQFPEEKLRACFGQHGAEMARRARGIDKRPVVVEHERKSVSQERTFSRDLRDAESLKKQLWRLSRGVAQHLQKERLAAGTVGIKLRYGDFETLTRQMSLSVPTNDERVIYRAAVALLRRTWQRGRPVRLLGVAGQNLGPPARQLSLF